MLSLFYFVKPFFNHLILGFKFGWFLFRELASRSRSFRPFGFSGKSDLSLESLGSTGFRKTEKSGKNNNFDRSSFSRFRRQQNWTWTEKNWNYFPFFTLTPTYLATFQPTYLPSAF